MDIIGNKLNIVLVGGGNVGEEIARTADLAGISLSIAETRQQFCTRAQYPKALERVCAPCSIIDALGQIKIDENTAIICTKTNQSQEVIDYLAATPAFYIGILSSRTKVRNTGRFHSPIGLDIGGETPGEIAISTVSEIMMRYYRRTGKPLSETRRLIIVRGAGDLATGVIIRLHRAGYPVLALEIEQPTVIRRTVSFAEAMFKGSVTVEGIEARKIESYDEAFPLIDKNIIPVLADPKGETIGILNPQVVIDAILAKRNINTTIDDAPLVIALGPGFTAKKDCDFVIETMRGHNLGKIISEGMALPNTGTPGIIAGQGTDRVIHSPVAGIFRHAEYEIGDIVEKGDTIAYIGETPVPSKLNGMLRGLLREGIEVPEHFKIADVDPRGKDAIYTAPSDKAYAIAGGVLECVCNHFNKEA